jgi:hypothetical protein
MRKALLLFAVLGLAGSLWAADPIIGTWKLNIAKSVIIQTDLKERTEAYREIEGDQIERSSGPFVTHTWPRQGGMAKIQFPGSEGITFVQTLIAPGEWYVTTMRNGKQISVRHKVISKDGKTMTQTYRGTDSEGKPFEQLEVYDKQ